MQQLSPSRRDFVKKLAAAGAAAPVIATFSLAAMSQAINSSQGSSHSSASSSDCQPDPGYIGPGRFSAHLAYVGDATDTGGRSNGEVHFVVRADADDDDSGGKSQKGGKKNRFPRVRTRLDLVGDTALVFGSAYLLINGGYAVTLQDGDASFDASDVNGGFCDLDYVLNAMAGGLATVLVQATYLGNNINLSGPITPAGPGFDFVNMAPSS